MSPAARRALPTVARLERLLDLAIASMFRAEPGTDARRIRTERQASVALWLMHEAAISEHQKGRAA
ncbi:hypothetical protein [Deinococcus sp. Marseille-Q6407]|uniref:hypothetical protein n=1 Tax=Deinococcus sp. Marseille-Q6407 TaxID=2969223 RepID=UPI0021BF555B|nr:hypothetical protein [Deinococcus sp. Marseille-Q6407]